MKTTVVSRRITLLAFTLGLSACSSIQHLTQPNTPAKGIDGAACVGHAPAHINGLKPVKDDNLTRYAQGITDKGGLCDSKTFKAVEPITVYRVYDGSKPYTATGRWWSFNQPVPPKDQYRKDNAICPEWSNLDRLTVCKIQVNAVIAVGTTQSATCADGSTYPKNANIQVYIPNDSQNKVMLVDNCQEQGEWPSATP